MYLAGGLGTCFSYAGLCKTMVGKLLEKKERTPLQKSNDVRYNNLSKLTRGFWPMVLYFQPYGRMDVPEMLR